MALGGRGGCGDGGGFHHVGAMSGSGKTPRGFPTPLSALPPDLPSGTVNKLSVGGTMHNQHQTGMLLPNMSKEMPSEAEFATWDRPSQEALWRQRKSYYTNRLRLSDAQRECRLKQLWPGGDKPYVVDRLLRYECCPGRLTPADTQTHASMIAAAEREFPVAAKVRMLFNDGAANALGGTEEWFSGTVTAVESRVERRPGATDSFQLRLPHVDVLFPDGSVERSVPLLVDDQLNAELRAESHMDYVCDAVQQMIRRVEWMVKNEAKLAEARKLADAARLQREARARQRWETLWAELAARPHRGACEW